MTSQPVPVHPAAHYAMGGVCTDLEGRTSVPRLFAAGEVACTGVHGANRLASNSLLEGIVFGARAGRCMSETERGTVRDGTAPAVRFPDISASRLRALAWEKLGIVRTGEGLQSALDELSGAAEASSSAPTRALFELRNMVCVATLIARCALARRESRGGHFRADFPGTDEALARHSAISMERTP